jgi:tetratricopeptide (TPR) repeat protein
MFSLIRSPLTRSPFSVVLVLFLVIVLGAGAFGWVKWRRTSQPEYLLSTGEQAIEKKRWSEVDEIANRLELAGLPDYASYLRGEKDLAKGDQFKALEQLHKVREDSRVGVRARLLQANTEAQLRDLFRARTSYSVVIALDPDNTAAHWGLAVIYHSIGAWNDAIAECREVARLDDSDGRPHGHMGLMYQKMSQYEQAAACYRDALSRNLSDHRRDEVRWELAETLLKLKQPGPARELLEKVSEPNRNASTHIALLAECDWQQNDHEGALARIVQVIGRRPRSSEPEEIQEFIDILLQGCRYLRESKQPERAFKHLIQYQSELSSNPEYVDMFVQVGQDMIDLNREQPNAQVTQELEKLDMRINGRRISGINLGFVRFGDVQIQFGSLRALLKRLTALRDQIHELEDKSHKDRTDRESRKKLSELWAQLGREDLAAAWRDASIAALP